MSFLLVQFLPAQCPRTQSRSVHRGECDCGRWPLCRLVSVPSRQLPPTRGQLVQEVFDINGFPYPNPLSCPSSTVCTRFLKILPEFFWPCRSTGSGGEGMESNHPRNVTPRNSVLKTGTATGPYPPPQPASALTMRAEVSLARAITGKCWLCRTLLHFIDQKTILQKIVLTKL